MTNGKDQRRRRKASATHDPLDDGGHLAGIRAARDDDAPRLVYADWLLERGDPRGELILLQCQPPTMQTKRQVRSLLDAHEKRWLGELAHLTRARTWERGFLAEATITRWERGVVAKGVGDPRWWSVERLDARGVYLDPSDVASLVVGAGDGALVWLTVTPAVLERLVARPEPWAPRVLEVRSPGQCRVDVLAAAVKAPNLRELILDVDVETRDLSRLERPGLSIRFR